VRLTMAGHSGLLTTLSVSHRNNMIVSGSTDGTTIAWELWSGEMLWRSPARDVGVNTTRISAVTGDVMTTWPDQITVRSINGTLLASTSTRTASNSPVSCACFTHKSEMKMSNIIFTGHSDGVIGVWTLAHWSHGSRKPDTPRARWKFIRDHLTDIIRMADAEMPNQTERPNQTESEAMDSQHVERTPFCLRFADRLESHTAPLTVLKLSHSDLSLYSVDRAGKANTWQIIRTDSYSPSLQAVT